MKIFIYKNIKTKIICKHFSFLGKSPLVETQQILKLIRDEKTNFNNLKIVDCTVFKQITEINEENIPNSIYINALDLTDNKITKNIDLSDEIEVKNPFAIPSNEEFSKITKKFNLKKSDTIIFYDRLGVYIAQGYGLFLKFLDLKMSTCSMEDLKSGKAKSFLLIRNSK